VLKEEAHCGHAAAGARLQREENHDELQPPLHREVRYSIESVVNLTKKL